LAERERAVEAWEHERDARERGPAGRPPGTPAP